MCIPSCTDFTEYCNVLKEWVDLDDCQDKDHFYSGIKDPSNKCLECDYFIEKYDDT